MRPNAATLIRHGLALDIDERTVVANALLESSSDTDEVDDTWRVEVSKRLEEMRSGTTQSIDAAQHFARLRASLTA